MSKPFIDLKGFMWIEDGPNKGFIYSGQKATGLTIWPAKDTTWEWTYSCFDSDGALPQTIVGPAMLAKWNEDE